jgi:lysophospholipase L1-like esterase
MRRPVVFAVSLAALGLGFLLAEGAVRLGSWGPEPALRLGDSLWDWGDLIHQRSEVPGLAYELTPGLKGRFMEVQVSINEAGLRGPPVRPVKGRWLRRVAVLGDSTTYGWGVDAGQTWSAALGRALDARGDGYVNEVLNFGVSGYSSQDEAVVLEAKALPLDPDLVLLGYNLNDPEFEPRQPLHRFYAEPSWWEGSRLLRFCEQRWQVWRRKRLGGGDPFRLLHADGTDTWSSVENAFERMGRHVDGAGIDLLLVLFPLGRVPADPAEYRYADLHAQVAEAARAAGLEVLDLVPAYAAAADGPVYLLPDMHPNPLGHEIAAQAVAERLSSGPPSLPVADD